jgi:hypothetical protein
MPCSIAWLISRSITREPTTSPQTLYSVPPPTSSNAVLSIERHSSSELSALLYIMTSSRRRYSAVDRSRRVGSTFAAPPDQAVAACTYSRFSGLSSGLGVPHLKHSSFEAKTEAPQLGHVQSCSVDMVAAAAHSGG